MRMSSNLRRGDSLTISEPENKFGIANRPSPFTPSKFSAQAKAPAPHFPRSSTMLIEEEKPKKPMEALPIKVNKNRQSGNSIPENEDSENASSHEFICKSPIKPQEEEFPDFEEWAGPAVQDKEQQSVSEVSAAYRGFANKNIANIEILSTYCDELTNDPYEGSFQQDVIVGRWLDEIIPNLSQELFPLMSEVSKFHIDTSILDIYKNLLVQIGKRYDIQIKIQVKVCSYFSD